MSAYEQKMEPPDKRWQYLLFAAEPYETIAFKVCVGNFYRAHLLVRLSDVAYFGAERDVNLPANQPKAIQVMQLPPSICLSPL